ncbi:ABC transporter permease [Legionella taurinensis]|uniref:ABC transporter permease n=1 Tax=Legionella taurinensis TaxID=70611 RepID=UPI000E76E2E6|nr:FtsX-like permease family protein [Legionella taurinensis]RJT66604.1 ABC transporter permease [Legionella taurinensis]
MFFLLSIANKYLNYHRRATIVAVLGVAIGVGFYIALAALLQGLQQYFTEQVINNSPHIVLKDEFRTVSKQPSELYFTNPDNVQMMGLKPKNDNRGIRGSQKIISGLTQRADIEISPVLSEEIFLQVGSRTVTALLYGIIPKKEEKITHLNEQLLNGAKLSDFYTTPNGIILGEGLARKLGVKQGDSLFATSNQGNKLNTKVIGLFRSGIASQDDQHCYMLLNKVQVLVKKKNTLNQIKMRVTGDVQQANTIAKEIENTYLYKTQSWQELNQNIFRVFTIQNGVLYTCTAALLTIALFSMYNIISTIVNEKKKDIAILKSMGFQVTDIRTIFLLQGITIGVTGCLLGWLIGFTLVEGLSAIRFENSGFTRTQGFVLNKSYSNYLISAFFAFSISILAAILPARKASALLPVDIIRGDT